MREEIKTWTRDGFELTAYTIPDEDADHPAENNTPPEPDDEYADTWATYLNRYEQGDWYYVGVIVEARLQNVELASASLWGIESDAPEYHQQVADELADEAIAEARETLTRLLEAHAR